MVEAKKETVKLKGKIMGDYSFILFDLDGTVTDPGEGITNSVAFALEKFGIVNTDRSELYKFIGPPLIDSFKEYYGFSPEQARDAVKYYREYYSIKGIFENNLHEGIPELLRDLNSKGKKVILATSKPEQFALQILEHFGIDKYFTFVAGATMDETRTKKDDVIAYALKCCEITELQNVIMVGDREYDIIGAANCGIDSLGVLFGYGSKNELVSANATFIAASTEELRNILL